jgi:hypothetical protein
MRSEEPRLGAAAAAAPAKVNRTPNTPPATAGTKLAAASARPAKSPAAATHKTPARKASVEVAAVERTAAVRVASFDVAAHHDEISKEAYYHWLRRGAPQSSEEHDWLAAIEIVRARYSA